MRLAAAVVVTGLLVSPVAAQMDSEGNPVDLSSRPDQAVPSPPSTHAVGVQVFNNQAAFLAATGPLTCEDFESQTPIGDCNSGPVAVIDFGPFRVEGSTPSGLPPLKIVNLSCTGAHNTTPGGDQYMLCDPDVAFRNPEVDFEFDAPICAFGITFTDIEQGIEVNVNDVFYLVPATPDGGEAFFGIIDTTQFVTVEIRVAVGSDSSFGIDDVCYGCPECFLVVGDGFGQGNFYPGIHPFNTQVGSVQAWYGTLMEFLPEFVLPTIQTGFGAQAMGVGPQGQLVQPATPGWMADGEFSVQIAMWNPGVFPALPEQLSHGLWVKVKPDGSIVTRPFGPGTGIQVWAETGLDSQGRPVVRFPFTIPGL